MHVGQVKSHMEEKTGGKKDMTHKGKSRKKLKKNRVVCIMNCSPWWKHEYIMVLCMVFTVVEG